MPKEDDFSTIAEAIVRLRHAFLRAGFSAPKSIELGTYEDGTRFRSLAPSDMMQFNPDAMAKGIAQPEWVGNFYGVEVRMPAQWRADIKGKRHAI